MTVKHIRRFSRTERLFHIFLMVTFLIQAATGFSRLFLATEWGRQLTALFGGYESSYFIHVQVGFIMLYGFLAHIAYVLVRVDWRNLKEAVFGPDSLIPNLKDVKDFRKNILWIFGLGPAPQFDRWSYWEKFDYWAVFWGMPILGLTGIMLFHPLDTSRILPGWSINIAALLHRAEAVLATSYIFIVHFSIGHLRPSSFPMNEAMFSGNIPVDLALHEKPGWVARLKRTGRYDTSIERPPAFWFRVLYLFFGYSALSFGLYLLISGVFYSRYVNLH